MIEDLLFSHESHQTGRLAAVERQAGEGEIEIARVIDRHDRATGGGQVFDTGDREIETLDTPQQTNGRDHSPVCRLHSGQPSARAAKLLGSHVDRGEGY